MYIVKKDKTKRNYELTFLLPADFTSAETKTVTDELEALIKKHKGELISQDDWGKKYLAYKIFHAKKRYAEANYFHWVVAILPEKVISLEKELYLAAKIIRHLLVIAA